MGSSGPEGFIGAPGPVGPKGENGHVGRNGPSGPNGDKVRFHGGQLLYIQIYAFLFTSILKYFVDVINCLQMYMCLYIRAKYRN